MSFVEKPAEPPSNLAATACYLFHREHLKLVATYLEEGNVAGPARPVRRVAPSARAGVRLPLQRRVAGHRRPRPAPRGGQPGQDPRRRVPASRVRPGLSAAERTPTLKLGGVASLRPRRRRYRRRAASTVARSCRFVSRDVTIAPQPARSRVAPAVPSTRGHGLLDLLLPQRCVACGLPGAQVCTACLVALPRLRGPRCERCCAPTAWPVRRCRECAGRRLAFARARSAVAYDDSVSRLVHAWKERGLRRLAAAAAEVTADALEHRRRAARLRPARSRATSRPWPSPRRGAGARARRPLGRPRPRGSRPRERRSPATRSHAPRAPGQRARSVPGHSVATRRRAGRRRLHDRRDGQRRGLRTPPGRRAARRGRDVRARGSWVYSDDHRLDRPTRRTRCDFR